jgi:hypothetical protein
MNTPDQNDVSTALGLLRDSLAEEEQRIRSEGASAMQAGDYDTATAVIEFAKRLLAFQNKVEALGTEWGTLEDLRDAASPAVQEIVSTRLFHRKINADFFQLPINEHRSLRRNDGRKYLTELFGISEKINSMDVEVRAEYYRLLCSKSEISIDEAKFLAQCKTWALLLNVENPSIEVLEILITFHETLIFTNLKEITEEMAQVLCKHSHGLEFKEKTIVSDNAFKILAKSKSSLKFEGSHTLTVESARALSTHSNELEFGAIMNASDIIMGLLLKRNGELIISNKEYNTISVNYAKKIFVDNHESENALNDLMRITHISDEVSAIIADYHGDLNLNRLIDISDQTAKELSRHYGYLNLDGISALSNCAADHLSNHKGKISLYNLVAISEDARKSLQKHGDIFTKYTLREFQKQTQRC